MVIGTGFPWRSVGPGLPLRPASVNRKIITVTQLVEQRAKRQQQRVGVRRPAADRQVGAEDGHDERATMYSAMVDAG